ncbi:MAG: helix-turn-helix transcriptional regulator [Clostridia bacterium]|nr:helix-turn-helix transcriptional regulator [Clostridia bacterium]
MLDTLANNLVAIRRIRKMTQKDVASQIGITATALSAYEKGQREPTLGVIIKLADYYGVTLDWLCGHEKSSEPETITRADFLRFLSYVYEEIKFKPNVSDLRVACDIDIKNIDDFPTKDAAILIGRFERYYNESPRSNFISKVTFEFTSIDPWMFRYFQDFDNLVTVQKMNDLPVDVVTPWKHSELSKYEKDPLFKPVKEED